MIRQTNAAQAVRGLEIIVLGSAPSAPQPDGQGSGLLVRAGGDTLLLDCGTGVVQRLAREMEPHTVTAVLITHLHADHFLDLVSFRYGLPWAGVSGPRIPVYLPPGGAAQLGDLARAISEDGDFFARALDLREYQPESQLTIGSLAITFVPTRHYVPAWGVAITGPGGRPRLVVSSDTGPNPALVEAARGADLLVVEATLGRADEDVTPRGHLAADEAVEAGRQAGVGRVLLTHLPSERRAALRAQFARSRPPVSVARPGLRILVPDER